MCMYSNIRHILGVTHLIKVKHDTDVWYIIFCHTVRSNEWDSIFYVSVVGRHQNFELPRIDSLSLHAVELAEFKEAHWFCAVYLSCDRVGIEFHQWINSFYKWHPLWFWGTIESDARLTLLYHILAKEFFPSSKRSWASLSFVNSRLLRNARKAECWIPKGLQTMSWCEPVPNEWVLLHLVLYHAI